MDTGSLVYGIGNMGGSAMTPEQLREKVKEALAFAHCHKTDSAVLPELWEEEADAAIAVCMEAAADVCKDFIEEPISPMPSDNGRGIMNGIRALIPKED